MNREFRFKDFDVVRRIINNDVQKNNELHKDKNKILITNMNNFSIPGYRKISSIDELPKDEIKNSLFFLFFEYDDEFLYHLDKIIKNNGTFTIQRTWAKNKFFNANKKCGDTLRLTSRKGSAVSHLVETVHQNICQAIEQTKNLEGDYVEIGVMRGGSAYTAATFMKLSKINRQMHLLDTFDGFNYEEAKNSADAHWNGTHKLWGMEKTMKHVQDLILNDCPNQKLKLTAANICSNNLPKEIKKIAVANIDVDMYEATRDAINKVAPLIVKGGIMICEDPTSTPGLIGAFYAMEKFLETPLGKKFMKLHLIGQYFLIKMTD